MARLTDTLDVDADLERCFALLTSPPTPLRSIVLGLGGQRVEYRDTTVEVTAADPARHRVVLTAGDGAGRLRARIAATLHAGPAGTRIDLVTDLDVTGSGADVARALLPSASRRLLRDLTRDLPPAPTPAVDDRVGDVGERDVAAPRRSQLLVGAGVATAAALAAAAAVARSRRP